MSIIIQEDSPLYEAAKVSEEKPIRQFKGVWIPRAIWEHPDLSWMEKCLWAEIDSLGSSERPCFASNEFLAKKLDSTGPSIANMVSRLRKRGLVKDVSFDGRRRQILAVTSEIGINEAVNQGSRGGEGKANAVVNIDTSIDSRREEEGASTSPSPEEPLNLQSGSRTPSLYHAEQTLLPAPPRKSLPETDLHARARKWFRRRPTRKFDPKEDRSIRKHLASPPEESELKLLDWWFSLPYEDCIKLYGAGRRKGVESLFNNLNAEIEKAEQAKAQAPQRKIAPGWDYYIHGPGIKCWRKNGVTMFEDGSEQDDGSQYV